MQDFTGIEAKLKRAEDNVFDLDEEITRFFEEGDHPILPQTDSKLFLEAIQYQRNRAIPPRFSVLAGEIVHHLRSCFDHIAWHFSIGATDKDKGIDFPVFLKEPVNADDGARFKRKVKRIQDPQALGLIKRLQPYNASDPFDDPLWIIHDFDIVDKHRQLVLSIPTGTVFFPVDMEPIIEAYKRAHPELDPVEVAHQFQDYGTLRPYISFRDFGRREFQPVIPGLVELYNYSLNVANEFKVL